MRCATRWAPATALRAGFLCAWLGGRDLAGSLAFGVACGSLSTRGLGGVETQATLAEASAAAERLLAGAAAEDRS